MDPEDPRFEHAVAVTLARFKSLAPHLLEDMAQELRIALWQSEVDKPYTVAYRRAMDWWRRYWGRESTGQRGWANREIPFSSFPGRVEGSATSAWASEHDFERMTGILGPRKARVMYLYYAEGMTIYEIAEELGTTWSNVGFIMRRARAKIRRLLESEA